MELALGKRLRELPGPIMITGHTGFKGTWLTLLMEQLDVPVIGLSLEPEKDSLFDRAKRTGSIPELFADIRNFEAVARFTDKYRPSAVIHMAAQPLVLESYKNPRETFETNVIGTVNILDAAFKSETVDSIIVATTDKVYRNDGSNKAFIETDALAGKDPYSASKVGTEAVVSAWQQIGKISGGPKVVSVRAGNVIGGGDWAQNRLMPDLIRGLISGDPIQMRNPNSTRPWQHVLDPLRGYIMTLEAVLAGIEIPTLNFGPTGESLTVKEVAKIAESAWPAETNFKLIEEPTNKQLEAESLQLDSNAARKILGWLPKWTQSEAVNCTVEWWSNYSVKMQDPIKACLSDIDKILR